jgi:hypothetical protein
MSIPANIKKFRTAIIPGAIFVFVGGMALILCFNLITDGLHVDLHALVIVGGFGVIFSFLWSWLMSVGFPVGFSKDGFYGYSFWGRRRFVSWQQIATARTFRLFNLKWLRIYAADGKITCLALFQSHGTEFREEIRRLAPPSNPVLQLL